MIPSLDYGAVTHGEWRIWMNGLLNDLEQIASVIPRRAEVGAQGIVKRLKVSTDLRQGGEGLFQGEQFTRSGVAQYDTAAQPSDVLHVSQRRAQRDTHLHTVFQLSNRVQSRSDRRAVDQ